MNKVNSRRSRILRRVLEYINAGSWWAERNGLLAFGTQTTVQACLDSAAPSVQISNDAVKEAQAVRSKVLASRGRRAAAKRVTIGKLPAESTKAELEQWLLGLAPARRAEVTRYILENLSACCVDPETGAAIVRDEDNLDAALAADMLDQLDRSVAATREYRVLRVKHASPWVQQYFDEAQRCYLYGFEVACAVLCRGLLEAILIDLVDPTYRLSRYSRPHHSHLSCMIDAAKGKFLDDNGVAAAELIRDCGNSAIHDLKIFREEYVPRLGEIMDATRRIVSLMYK
ncbi:MAG: DUF4145 domain-containing protein [Terriglobales bacterium]